MVSAVAPVATPIPDVADRRWRLALDRVLRRPRELRLHAQPIVELGSGEIAGYELLSRFPATDVAAPPDRWFAAAERWGVNVRLQSLVLTQGLAFREALPPDTFITVNVEPHLLTHTYVPDVLLAHPDLSRVVVELTEHTRADDTAELSRVLGLLRDRGALIAMDDAGTGYAGLSQLLALRPDIVKLDRDLISGIDLDPAKRALVEVVGDLVGRLDGWILAEGIETPTELDAVVRLGVPLGQGYALAHPDPVLLPRLAPDLARTIRSAAGRARLDEHVVSLLREASTGTDPETSEVLLGQDGRPRAVRWGPAGTGEHRWSPALVVAPSATLTEVALRAATRPALDVAAPLVCTNGTGQVLGLILLGDLLVALATSSRATPEPTSM